MTTRDEVLELYGKVMEGLFAGVREAAKGQADRGLDIGPAGLAIGFTRASTEKSYSWMGQIGFQNWNDVLNGVNWELPPGQFPPLELPINLQWTGNDHWGVRRDLRVAVPPILLNRNRVSWLEKAWENSSEAAGQWILNTLVERWLLQDSPQAAQEKAALATPGGRWEKVGRPLKTWGPNEVWEVRDRQDVQAPRRVMKLLRFRKGPTSGAHKRLVREIEITRELGASHRGIVPVLDFGIPQDGDEWTPFYVMPRAESTLAKAKDFQGNLESVLRLGIELARALAAAHERGVVHRDVKPENILLLGDERQAVVADFGICFLVTEEGDRITATEAGTVGPANYVAPELLGGRVDAEDIDGRADIYSLGKTLYYALSGGDIFPREYFAQDEYDLRKKTEDPRLEHFYGLLERMVVEKPDGRFPNMQSCCEALERALTNIMTGVTYEVGMYGSAPTPAEAMGRFRRELQGTSGAARADLLRNTISEARRQLHDSTRALENAQLSGGEALMMQAGFKGGERLLAIGLPLLRADDHDGFERWLEAVTGSLRTTGTHRPAAATSAAGALAFHGAAVAALHTERLNHLQTMLTDYHKHRSHLVHLTMFGDGASRSWEWLAGCLSQSEVLERFEPGLIKTVGTVLTQVAGLAVLRFLLGLSPQDLAQTIPEQGELEIHTMPGLMPQGCEWVESLPQAFIAARSLERAVADRIFSTTPENLRGECKRITPKLARALKWMAHKLNRSPVWLTGIPRGGQWTAWCGGLV